ncbi:MAG: hypothetical protein WC130_08955, partial [Kiritimatiellia bacterium]
EKTFQPGDHRQSQPCPTGQGARKSVSQNTPRDHEISWHVTQILSVNAFEKVALQELLTQTMPRFQDDENRNQLMLFDL